MGSDTTVTFNSNGTASNVSLPGIVAGFKYNATTFGASPSAAPNDGSNVTSTAYNFGSTGSKDRALGGMAGSLGASNTNTTGYVAVRLQSAAGNPTIRNLDVRYAIEQWYNSAQTAQAFVQASYRIYATSSAFSPNDLVQDDGSNGWTAVPALKLQAPATGGLVGSANGNSTTYRRTAQARLLGVNLAPGMEVVVRFYYYFNTSTNGNGISVDDIAIYPETNILYSSSTGMLSNTSNGSDRTWSLTADGGTAPASAVDFTAANTTYYIQGNTGASRLGSSGWNVSGTNSRVIVGTDNNAATLLLAAGDAMTATVDVNTNSTLQIADRLLPSSSTPASNLNLTFGSLDAGSTVSYTATGTQNVLGGNYQNLTLAGTSSAKFLLGNITVGGTLSLQQTVALGKYNLAMLGAATLSRGSAGQVQANAAGTFQRVVPGKAASAILFPMAVTSAANDYLPVTITSGSSDLDDNYKVQLIDGVYKTYAGTTGTTASATTDDLAATWFLSHETTTPVAAAVQVGWTGGTTREGSRLALRRAQAYLDHYTTSSNTWDASPANRGATQGSGDNLWYVTRTGVSNFSPFAITANNAGPLPVQLISFVAHRAGSAVLLAWATASELYNDHFEVERSPDGKHFASVGQVAGQGSKASRTDYTYTDEQPLTSLAYYRLRQVATDGATNYSAVATVRAPFAEAVPTLAAVPNPSAGQFTLLGAGSPLRGTVYNTLGQAVLTFDAATDTQPLDLGTQPAGLYLVRVQTLAGSQVLRLLKQ